MLRKLTRAAVRRVRGGPSPLSPLIEVPSFDAAFDRETAASPRQSYAICATPRSGSTLLCHGLWVSEVGGRPAEYFNYQRYPPLLARWRCLTLSSRLQRLLHFRTSILRFSESTLHAYRDALLRWRTGENGVFGLKIHAWQWLRELAPLSLEELFPGLRYIAIRRDDLLRQAISLVRARQTNQYRGSQPAERLPRYDAKAIRAAIEELAAEEATWARYFDGRGIAPLVVTYEQLVSDYTRTTAAALRFAGASPGADFALPPPILRRQADRLTEEWWDRYQRESEP